MPRHLLSRCLMLLWPLLPLAATPPVASTTGPASRCPAPRSASGPSYLLGSQADLVALLSPPPAADSAAQQADLQAVLEAQRAARSYGTIAHAVADAEPSCARYSDALGEALTDPGNAKLLEFLNRAAIEGAALSGPAKKYWKRTRPFAVSDQVQRLGDMSPAWKAPSKMGLAARDLDAGRKPTGVTVPSAAATAPGSASASACSEHEVAANDMSQNKKGDNDKAAQELAHSSYPSGHSTFGTVCAILLADMVPEKRVQLFARNRDYGHSRLVLGAHYPSDIEAGRIVGTLAVELMTQNAKFEHDFADARSTLRSALQLPAQPADLEPKSVAADADSSASVH